MPVAARAHVVVALLALLMAGACGGEGGSGTSEVAVVDSGGVDIVENTTNDRPATRTAVRLTELQPPDSALVPFPWGVDADPETGRIYVLDGTAPRVVVFDRSGAYVGTLGREGGGPGEFRDPSALSTSGDGTLTVWDTGRGVLSRWSAEGELVGERPAPPIPYFGPGLHLHDGRMLTVTSGRSPAAVRQVLVSVAADDSSATDTTVLHTVSQEMATVNLPCMQAPMPRVLEPTLAWTATGDTSWAVSGPGYRIDVFAGGEMVASVRRPVDPVTVTAEMAAERARLQFRGFLRRCGISAETLVKEVGHAERVTPIRWIAADPRGRLWVTRGAGNMAAERVDLLSPEGRYRGTVDAGVMPVAFVSSTRFVGLRIREEIGRPVLSLWNLEGEEDTAAAPAGDAADGRPAWAPPVRRDLREFRDCPECPVMVELPPGTYTMGSPGGEAPAGRRGMGKGGAAGDPRLPK